MVDYTPFNPLDRKNLAASVAEALLERPVVPLGQIPFFAGAGIYAIYYTGSFSAYGTVAEANSGEQWDAPIYVGKAIPKGGRKGGFDFEAKPGAVLKNRLDEHAVSVEAAKSTLRIDDFFCRFLVVEDIWIPLGENLMISKLSPVWNTLVDGFGNHDPGSGRYNGLCPRWDVIHPGRGWAAKCRPRAETAHGIILEVTAYLRSRPIQKEPKLF